MILRLLFTLTLLLTPALAGAADDRAVGVGGTVSALNAQSHTDVALSGDVTFSFNRVVGLDMEATLVPNLTSRFDGPVILNGASALDTSLSSALSALGLSPTAVIYPGPTFSHESGRLIVFSNNVRLAIPTTSRRVTPYFIAGGGIGHIRRTADLTYTPSILVPAPGIAPVPTPVPRAYTQQVVSSEIDLALTLGGGVDVQVTSRFSVTGDLRLIRLIGDADQNVGRFGGGVRYSF